MTRNAHDEARELLALGDGLPDTRQAWLRSHLEECESCRHYAEAVSGLVRSLRSLPVTADSRLVLATQMRVRFHAGRLREARERMWLLGITCMGVGLSATLTLPLLWRLFAWVGESARVSSLVWQAGFLFFVVAPALLVSVLLLVRGTSMTTHEEQTQHWR